MTVNKNDVDYLLYAVTDFPANPRKDPVESVRSALQGGATVLQLREKNLDTAGIVALAEKLIPLCRERHACFIINDDVEAARLCGADGVHIGQHDQELKKARAILGPDVIIGVSVQTVEQARQACADSADYLGVGAVFPTTTKADADAVSYETLKAICEVSTVPVVAIGGINLENVSRLSGSGIDGVAVVSAIFGAEDICAAASNLRGALSRLDL